MTEPEYITHAEVGMLLALAATRDQRTVGDADILAWHKDLNTARIAYPNAEAALNRYYAVDQPALPREHRFRVAAADIIANVKKARSERLKTFTYEPPPTLDDPQYIERLRGQIAAVVSGTMPAPTDAPMLEGGPRRAIADSAAGIGRKVPGEDGEDPLAGVRRVGPLSFECPVCKAQIGRQCRRGTQGKPRRISHQERLVLAAGKPLPTAEERDAAQRLLEQRLAFSRAKAEAEPSDFVPPTRDEVKPKTKAKRPETEAEAS